eukprot:4988097-Prymnesium_polylepis.1
MPRYGNTSRSDVSLDKTPQMNTTKLHAGRVNRPALTMVHNEGVRGLLLVCSPRRFTPASSTSATLSQ